MEKIPQTNAEPQKTSNNRRDRKEKAGIRLYAITSAHAKDIAKLLDQNERKDMNEIRSVLQDIDWEDDKQIVINWENLDSEPEERKESASITLKEKIIRLRKLITSLTPEEKMDPEIAAMLRFFAPLL